MNPEGLIFLSTPPPKAPPSPKNLFLWGLSGEMKKPKRT